MVTWNLSKGGDAAQDAAWLRKNLTPKGSDAARKNFASLQKVRLTKNDMVSVKKKKEGATGVQTGVVTFVFKTGRFLMKMDKEGWQKKDGEGSSVNAGSSSGGSSHGKSVEEDAQ